MKGEADIVVIGGGIVGSATAYHLARRGLGVVLVERNEIAGEQSGRNWGFVRQQGRDQAEVPLMIEANRIWRGLERELGTDIEWIQGGNLALAATEERLALFEEWLGTAREVGLDTRVLTRWEVIRRARGADCGRPPSVIPGVRPPLRAAGRPGSTGGCATAERVGGVPTAPAVARYRCTATPAGAAARGRTRVSQSA